MIRKQSKRSQEENWGPQCKKRRELRDADNKSENILNQDQLK